jgi:hypothetical protein
MSDPPRLYRQVQPSLRDWETKGTRSPSDESLGYVWDVPPALRNKNGFVRDNIFERCSNEGHSPARIKDKGGLIL